MFSPRDTADILVEALPYIKKFFGQTIVIKYGGNAMISDELKSKVITDITLMKYVGIRPVIVHGGGPDITGFLQKIGKKSEFVSELLSRPDQVAVLAGKADRVITGLAQAIDDFRIHLADENHLGDGHRFFIRHAQPADKL